MPGDLGGSRLTKFIEAVEATTAGIPRPAAQEREEAAEAKREFAGKPNQAAESGPIEVAAPADPWVTLLQAGAAVLQRMTAGSGSSGTSAGLVRKDETTGESYLRLPVPSEAAVADVVAALSRFLDGMRK